MKDTPTYFEFGCTMPHADDDWEGTDADIRLHWRRPASTCRPPYRGHSTYDYSSHPPPFHDYYHRPSPYGYGYTAAPTVAPPPQTLHPRTVAPPQASVPPPVVYIHQQSSSTAADVVYEVRDSDVLCGRGAPTNFHPGNQYFRKLVNEMQPGYLASRRADKPEIAMRIVSMIQERGGRFLKRTKMQGLGPSGHFCWQEIGEQRSYEKACQALREGAPEIRRRLAGREDASNPRDSPSQVTLENRDDDLE